MTEHCSFRDLSRLFSYPEILPGEGLLHRSDIFEEKLPDLIDLQNLYVSLFINSLPHVSCPPYGSVYLEGSCMGESTIKLRNIYRKYGFETDEMPDHIAVELEFLNYLEQLLPMNEDARSDFLFLINHLRCWTPAFFKEIEKHDKSRFYSAIAQAVWKALDKRRMSHE